MQLKTDIQYSLYGKTSPEPYQAEPLKEPILGQFSKRSQKAKFQCLIAENGQTPEWLEAMELISLGECLMPNIGESPNVGVESSLLQVLEQNAPVKYYLSKRACEGIIRRANNRGKVLPKLLETALLYRIITVENTELEKTARKVVSASTAAATLCASYGTKWNGNQGAYSGENFVLEMIPQNTNASTDNETIGFDGYNGDLTGVKISTLGVNCGMSTGRNGVIDHNKTAYGLCSYSSNSMKSPNPHSGLYEAETTRTLDSQGGNPSCNQR